jgi:hypothetical protein
VWMHERQHKGQTMSQVDVCERFNKAPPRRAKLLELEKRAFALVSVKDRPWSGRKTITAKILQRMSHRTWSGICLCVQHQGVLTD